MQAIKQQLNNAFEQVMISVSGLPTCNANVVTASKPEFGDYQVNGVMAIAKQMKCSPRELAQQVVDCISTQALGLIGRLEVAGPGFINVHIADPFLLEQSNNILTDPSSFIRSAEISQKIAVDYSSPNLAKEMHVGHLRGTIIGDCLVRVLEKLGHDVIRQNHVGDWGTQFGMLITHLRELQTENNNTNLQLADLEVFYRDAKARFDEDAEFASKSRLSVVKLQSGEVEYVRAWELFINESLKHCETVYDKLGVTLTRSDLDSESRYNDDLPQVIADLDSAQLLSQSDGANCVFLNAFKGKNGELLPLIVQKTDGGYLYATTDLAAIRLRMSQQIHRSLYVVDARQSLHFQQVFAVARKAEFVDSSLSLEHIAYGTIMGKDGRPFRTRSGESIKLIDLLDEAVKQAHRLVREKNPNLNSDEMVHVANCVGIGAVKYADLSKNRTSDYVFDFDTMLSFEGNTAPYLLYAGARIHSLLSKAAGSGDIGRKILEIGEPAERALLVKNLQLPEVVHAVAMDCYPNQLCSFLYELAGLFMRFYEECPILRSTGETMASRLALAQLTVHTLEQGMDLLGIESLEKM
ncbi:MAG: arginine--tRNA ligase [Gammaproteobacteria bacterium]|nr:arginine--tRNA ligase [Gammaproteobacteria bacterium]